tara:strand:+ start:1225 stop:1842 length:618 start_codon:yes stop_codon:yes gene_type:complete
MFEKKELKNLWKKFWFLLWKDDSLKGWVFSVVFLFIFIKFIFFPGLSLVTGTSLPLAIVESCSMYHDGNFLSDSDKWWIDNEEKYSQFDINKEDFGNFIFGKGFNKGDILFVVGANPEKIKKGDVIIFQTGSGNPIIHRVVSVNGEDVVFSTLGDNNDGQHGFEKNISEEKILGKAVFKIAPYFGWVKLIFFESKRPASERGFCE